MTNFVRKLGAAVLFLLATGITAHGATWPGTKSSFHSFDQFDFPIGDFKCKVVVPSNAAANKPWVWRARFFGHEPQFDIAMLERGYHVVYCDVAGLWGSPTAVERWNEFYGFLVEQHGFAKKAVLEGMSRGGLIVYNWAIANPDKVAAIYADAPVVDVKTWIDSKSNETVRATNAHKLVMKSYQFTDDAQADAYDGYPIDNLRPLAAARIPIIHVVGDADKVVPVSEHTTVLENRYKALGGSIQVIHKEGIGHHPHSLKDPKPLVDFVLQHALPSEVE